MSVLLRRILIGVVVVLALLIVVIAVWLPLSIRSSFPQIDGEVRLSSLDAPVDIYRDAFGIPHIYAQTTHDLFFAQGYVHAQDRFWQMDFWRHVGSARLSEMFGASQVETDTFLRTLGWARVAQQELDALDPDTLVILNDYANGVNAYLDERQGGALSLEYVILKLLNPDYQVKPWQPLHSLTWAKAMAWDLGGNMDAEIQRAVLLQSLTPEQLDDIFPSYPPDHPVIVAEQNTGAARFSGNDPSLASLAVEAAALLEPLAGRMAALEGILGPLGEGIGSNSWVISGRLSATGTPWLANDPHLGVQMPSIWYEVGLHCVPKGINCPFDVAGFSFAGTPGVVIGHNDRIAWGFTNVGPDVQDLYIERLNPENPNQYEVNGHWVDMEVVRETIHVAGGDPVEVAIRYTRHGPIISETYGELEEFTAQAGIKLPANYAVALRWTALDVSNTFPAIWQINKAQNWDEFRAAASQFDVPSQNLVYADIEGNIGYQTPGKIPIRAQGDGSLPVPGWTDDYEWQGFIPFEELPSSFNPPQGYLVTANNAVVGPGYPYLITRTWAYGYRAQRIVEMITSAPKPIDSAYIQHMQGDNKDLNAETLVPVLLEVPLNDPHLEEVRGMLATWDFQAHMDSAPAALFEAFWKHLLAETFHDDLPERYWPGGGSRWFEVVRRLVAQPEAGWWDNKKTTAVQIERRDDIFRQAFAGAVRELEEMQGNNPENWAWGELHTVTFRNATLGESGIAPIEALFNRGPYPTSGGESIVNATGWTSTEGYFVDWLPSMRMIVDLGNLQNSLAIHTTGQSGHAYHQHYIDMADLWRQISYHPMYWERAAIEAGAEGHLRLAP